MTRIYQPLPLKVTSLVNLDEKASHYLQHVLRVQAGEAITIFNGQGGEYQAVIKTVGKKGVVVEILAFLAREVESPLRIQLAQGMARGEKMDFIVQKAVELGVDSIVPLVTERCNLRLSADRAEKRRQHWQAVAVSACEQSGRNQVPTILPVINLSAWLPNVKADCRFLLSPQGGSNQSGHFTDKMSVVLLVGPEGGLTEVESMTAVHHGFMPLTLGPRILRTETAALAALSVLQVQFGDFNKL